MTYSIRPLQLNDYHDLQKVWSDQSVVDMMLNTPALNLNDSKIKVENTLKADNVSAFVVLTESGEIVGTGYIERFRAKRNHVGRTGLAIRSDFQGQGVGSLFMEQMINFAKSNLNLKVLELECMTDNEKALNLYKKFGFEIEGTLKKRVQRNGELIDLYVMSKILD